MMNSNIPSEKKRKTEPTSSRSAPLARLSLIVYFSSHAIINNDDIILFYENFSIITILRTDDI